MTLSGAAGYEQRSYDTNADLDCEMVKSATFFFIANIREEASTFSFRLPVLTKRNFSRLPFKKKPGCRLLYTLNRK